MWGIYEKKSVQKVLKRIPKDILIRYEAWKRIVEFQGPGGLRLIKGFHDEVLKGKWRGYRSSRLGLQWRVMYNIQKDYYKVYVFEINPHKY